MCGPRPTVLILASGLGTRYAASGGQGSKLQATLLGKPVLQHTLDTVRASGLPYHLESAAHPGMGDSIAAAVAATRDADGWLVLPGDLPLVQSSTLLAVADLLALHAVVVPVFGGQRGHPVGFGAACREALLGLSGANGAAVVVRAHGSHEVVLDDVGIVTDVDTVQDLERAAQLLTQRKALS